MVEKLEMEDQEDKASAALKSLGTSFWHLVFLPVIILEKTTGIVLWEKYSWVIFLTFATAAFAGYYHLILGWPTSPLYEKAIEFSDKSLINSAIIYGGLKTVQFLTSIAEVLTKILVVIPGGATVSAGLSGIAKLIEELSDLVGKGLLALAFQSLLLRLIQAGILMKWIMGGGLLLCVPKFSRRTGMKIVMITMIVFFTLPAVVVTEAVVYEYFSNKINSNLEEAKKEMGSVFGLSKEVFSKGITSIRKKWNEMVGDQEEAKYLQKKLEEQPSIIGKVKAGFTSILNAMLSMILMALFTTVIAPLVAYYFLIKGGLYLWRSMGERTFVGRISGGPHGRTDIPQN